MLGRVFCLLTPWLLAAVSGLGGWGEARARVTRDYLGNTDEVHTFSGNHTHSDHFKLLREDGNSLLIGARNVIYNLSLSNLEENLDNRINWNSRDRDMELCLVKGKSTDDCNNYIRVLAKVDSDQLLVCGTNAYNPRCRNYARNNESVYEVIREFSGKGYCPYDPTNNSTAIYADGELYSGTVSDFSGSDALIIKNQIRTGQYNLKELNGPDFVSSIEDKDFVYFFFREEAVEYMNCGKAVYSRVARVCKNDNGGPHTFKNKWTTFVKARLNCSMPGAYPFYFDQVQAMSQVVDTDNDKIIYGVFNTPENSITGSAVCSFRLSDIAESFDGPLKNQKDANSNWLPLARHEEPVIRPGSCRNNSQSLDDKYLNFIKENALMDRAVPSSINTPHFIKTSPEERLTTVAVDPRVSVADLSGQAVDVLFIGTTRGRVIKMASHHDDSGVPRTSVIEEIQVFPVHVAVRNLLVVQGEPGQGRQLVALSDHEVKALPLERCRAQRGCGACVGLQDPYCAWNIQTQTCDRHHSGQVDASSLLQNMARGLHPGCGRSSSYSVPAEYFAEGESEHDPRYYGADGENETPLREFTSSTLQRQYSKSYNGNEYSEQTLSVACVASALISLLLGFLGGFLFTKKCSSQDLGPRCAHSYLEAQILERSTKDPNSIYESPYTTHTPSMTTKNNLLSNLPVKSDTQKNNLTINSNTGTLGKCKKIYI